MTEVPASIAPDGATEAATKVIIVAVPEIIEITTAVPEIIEVTTAAPASIETDGATVAAA